MGARSRHAEQSAQTAYSNTIARERAKLNLKMQKQSWERRAKQVKEQYKENANEAARAYAETQAQYNEQMTQFAYQSQGMINQLAQVEGNMRARGTMAEGQSSRRAAQIMSVGEYGRQSTKLVQNIQSADRQLERNLQGLQHNGKRLTKLHTAHCLAVCLCRSLCLRHLCLNLTLVYRLAMLFCPVLRQQTA